MRPPTSGHGSKETIPGYLPSAVESAMKLRKLSRLLGDSLLALPATLLNTVPIEHLPDAKKKPAVPSRRLHSSLIPGHPKEQNLG